MAPVLLFLFLLLLVFGVLFFFLKPTSTEVAVQQHLAGIEGSRNRTEDGTILKQEAFSSNAWLDSLIKHLPGAFLVSQLIKQAGRDWRVSSVLLMSMATLLAGWWFASLMIPSLVISAGVALALAAIPYVYLLVLRQMRFNRFDALLPEAVDLMARGLRAGHAITAVLEMVGHEIGDPVGTEFRALYKEQSLGLPMRDAMMNLLERMPRNDLRFLVTAILLQKETGGNLAQILDKTLVVLRERARLRGQLRIYTAQGRITGWILCFAPFAMFGLISTFNRAYARILFTDPKGITMVYVALVMMVIGILIIRKIIDVKV